MLTQTLINEASVRIFVIDFNRQQCWPICEAWQNNFSLTTPLATVDRFWAGDGGGADDNYFANRDQNKPAEERDAVPKYPWLWSGGKRKQVERPLPPPSIKPTMKKFDQIQPNQDNNNNDDDYDDEEKKRTRKEKR